jgi:hypothetical protein
LAEFPSAVEAVQAAIEIQQSVEWHNIEQDIAKMMDGVYKSGVLGVEPKPGQ